MKEEILALEERLRLAMLNSNLSELDDLISANLIFTNHLGELVSKQQDLDAHSSGEFVFNSIVLSEFNLLMQEKAAVVSVKAEIQGCYNGEPANGNFRFTRFWSNTSGRWQIMAGHSSVIV